ncbi:sugar phosphate isomerase/epimerase, partial [Escherichia coli]
NVRQWWADQGIEITGMQALLFGTTGLNVFGDNKSQEALLEHMRAVCHIGAGLGAIRLVFGSPKNRDRSGLSDTQ